jgi:hypothetical protein
MTITATSDNQIRKSNMRNWAIGLRGAPLLRLDACELDYLGPFLGFVGNQPAEIT